MLLGSSGGEEEQEKEEEQKPVEMKKPEEPESGQIPSSPKSTQMPDAEPPDKTQAQASKSDEADLADRLKRSFEMSQSKSLPEEETPEEPVQSKPEQTEPPVEEKRELPPRDPGKPESPREVLERIRAEQAAKTQHNAEPQNEAEKPDLSDEVAGPGPNEDSMYRSAIPEADFASFTDDSDKRDAKPTETPPQSPGKKETDLNERLRHVLESGKSQLPAEEETIAQPEKEKPGSIRMPLDQKREPARDPEKPASPKEVLERLRAEQAASEENLPESPAPRESVFRQTEETTEPDEELPSLTTSADMLREQASQMGFNRQDSSIDKTPEITSREEPKAEIIEPAGVAASEMKHESVKKQEAPSQPEQPTASRESDPEPIEPPEIPKEPRKTSTEDFGSLRQVLTDREREAELEPKSPEAQKSVEAGTSDDEAEEKEISRRGRIRPPKKIKVHPPGPLSMLMFIGGAISVLGATIALAIGQTGTSVIGLGAIGVVLIGSFAIVNRHWMKVFLSSRSTRYSANVAMVIVSLMGILVFANIMAYRYHYRIDMSSEGLHSLSPQTLGILGDINRAGETITVTAFVPQNSGYRENVDELIEMYLYKSSLLEFTFVDPDVKLELAESKGITRTPSVLFELGENKSIITDIDEPHFTSALTAVRQTESRLVSFLAGHGEGDPFAPESDQSGLSKFREQLELEGYEVDTLRIPAANGVPPETSLLVIAGPTRDLQPLEISAIEQYLEQGGNIMVMLEPGRDAGLEDILAKYGIATKEGTVLDDRNNAFGELNSPIVVGNHEHSITESLAEGMVFSNAQALDYTTSERFPGVTTESLARSASSSWVETGGNRVFDEGIDSRESSEVALLSTLNPVGTDEEIDEEPSAEAGEAYPDEQESEVSEDASGEAEAPGDATRFSDAKLSQLLVVGDASFIRNASYDDFFNKDFALNAVSYLTARHDLISIRPNELKDRPLNLQNWQRSIIFAFSVILTPLLIAGLGGFVWWKRS